MSRFPEEFSELLSAQGREFLLRRALPPADLTKEGEHFFVLPDVIDQSDLCMRILERDFEGRLGPIRSSIPPEWITSLSKNFSDAFGKTMDVQSFIFRDPDSELYRIAEANGLLAMLRSDSLRQFGEALTGLELEGGWGSQIICYQHGHYVGPHSDHFPEFDWARHGYVDIQLMFANDAVQHQWFVHEKDGLLSQSWNINLTGAVSVFRQPFWHYTTPLIGKPRREREARRWLIGQVFRIIARSPGSTTSDADDDQNRHAKEKQRPRLVIPAATDNAKLTLETNKRLSESLLWEWQRRFYTEQGTAAWSTGTVPSRITSGGYLAAAYARIVRGFIEDCQRTQSHHETVDAVRLDPRQPLYILELGAGSGRFAHLFLDRLLPALSEDAPPIRYLLTDLAERNLTAWMNHPLLLAHIQAGRADVAICDTRDDGTIHLVESGDVLIPGSLHNPLVVVANYFFDSIENDLFRTHDGNLDEGRVSLHSTHSQEQDPTDPAILERCEIGFSYQPLASTPYHDPELNDLLDRYRAREGQSAFLLPVGAVRVLNRLRRLTGGRLFTLAADKGHLSADALLTNGEPSIAVHGSISVMVNFDALIANCEAHGGFVLRTTPPSSRLAVCALFLGLPQAALRETRLAFRESIASFGPLERHELAEAFLNRETAPSVDEILAVLHMTEDEPALFCRLAPILRRHIASQSGIFAENMVETLGRIWRNHFPIGGELDVAFEIATILQLMGRPAEAVTYYDRSINSQGDHFTTLHNLGLCYLDLQRPEDALRAFKQAALLNPEYEPAQNWRARLERELATEATEATKGQSTTSGAT